jgi:type III restriction enzyme
MRDILFPFQKTALEDLHDKVVQAHKVWTERNPQVISFSAPTGSGKTIIMTAFFEEILYGTAERSAEPDSVFIWLSDMPELNEQTRLKIESKSDKIRVGNLVTIDSNFDAEFFEGGCIYFLNTQKLGSDKLLTQKSDKRQFTIWETLTNTAKSKPKKFYVIIDEAHRGTYTSPRAESIAQTIMQKFIKGSPEDGLCVMPLVIGVTATPQRFQKLLDDTPWTVQKVIVPPEDVRDSGLLKDRIIIHYPDITINADMTLFKSAVDNWMKKCVHWRSYYEQEKDKEDTKEVKPVLVIQVEDGTDTIATRTDINECISILEECLGRRLKPGEVVHTFNDKGTLTVNNLQIHKIEASRIEENDEVSIVFFKMNLTTGWDCPRAETMMSFRSAQDYTYIAQLLGRMIRTPLARRIASDAELNNVSLFLPHFDENTVKKVVEALRDSDAAVPAETGTSKELVTLNRNLDFSEVFDAMSNLITYRIDAARKQSALRRLIQLSRALTQDGINLEAQNEVKSCILKKIEDEINRMKEAGEYERKVAILTGFELGTLTFDYNENAYLFDESIQTMTVAPFDITSYFDRAGKRLGEGLHIDYWTKNKDRDPIDVQLEVIVFTDDINAMNNLEAYCDDKFLELYENNQRAISHLSEARKDTYEKLINTSERPIPVLWELPKAIDFSEPEDSSYYEKHLYIKEDGTFKANLNPWEKGVLEEELKKGAIAWLRNLDRKKWSLEIPYKSNGITKPMYPDLIIVRKDEHGFIFDILEPHDYNRKDNCDKARGLAQFAEEHWDKFGGKIQLIRKHRGADGREHFYRLDMSKVAIRNIVRGISSNSELDRVFSEFEKVEEE